MTSQQKTTALIVAGGVGLRAGGELPKQYQVLRGKAVLAHTVLAFLNAPMVDDVWVVIHPEHEQLLVDALGELPIAGVVHGGATRQASVLAGLNALVVSGNNPDMVLVHDAARPFVSSELIENIIAEMANSDAVIPALAVVDTIKSVNDRTVNKTLNRTELVRVQTPQAFAFSALLDAHIQAEGAADGTFTDDASLMEAAGKAVRWVDGDEANIKLTSAADMAALAKETGAMRETRIGIGYDVHVLEEHPPRVIASDQVIHLCGLAVPHHERLKGHSDADVALHALVDALLGAMGKGDIGQHFPPSDAQFKGASSDIFVKHACNLLKEMNGTVVNVDVTIICERPKISLYRDAMVQSIARMMGVLPERINVKATTTERLGFTGRGEGIAAQAAVSIALGGTDE